MPVIKEDGRVWICGDYWLMVNRVSRLESYPIPRIEELYLCIGGRGDSFHEIGPETCISAACAR